MTGDRWRTAYDGSSLNRPDELQKKHFIGQADTDRHALANSSGDIAGTIGY